MSRAGGNDPAARAAGAAVPQARPGDTGEPGPIKCVVWDIDNTLLTGVYLESGGQPPGADPVLAGVLAELGGRGILQALASKNPPEAARHTAHVTGWEFAAAECGWGAKSDALTRIAAELGIGVGTLAFVDDDPYERAEVSSALPQVMVLSPEEAAEAAGWPEFSPPVVTAEARRRGQAYAERSLRKAAERSFGGTREEFLHSAGTRVTIAAATVADVPRLHELAVRTRQFNSAAGLAPLSGLTAAGQPGLPRPPGNMTGEWFRSLITSGGCDVLTVRLEDDFGDDGLVGGCVAGRAQGDAGIWTVWLIMMSCRAMGRGVIDALLAWLGRHAARAGARRLDVPCVLNDRNVPLRLALASGGFRAGRPSTGQPSTGPGSVAVFHRDLAGPLPGLPGWVTAPDEAGGGGA
jgi:predicted enzyme involved in methoxymalonyl-ACP biosynthesis